MSLPYEVRKLLKHLGFVRRRVRLAAEGSQLLELVVAVEPKYPERHDLMEGGRRESIHGGVPCQLGVGYGFDVED